MNKWDLIDKNSITALEYERALKERLKVFDYIPITFTSAKTKEGIYRAIEIVKFVYMERNKKVLTSRLNKTLFPIFKSNPPSSSSGREIKIKFVTQLKTSPPVFAFYANFPDEVPENYKKFIENKIRENFGFAGVPLTLVFKKK